MLSADNSASLSVLLDSGHPLVFPSPQAAAACRAEFRRLQCEAGNEVWQPPLIWSWHEWLSSLWSNLLMQGADDRVPLNRLQEATLWRSLLIRSPLLGEKSVPAIRELASLCQSAFRLAASHQVLGQLHTAADSPDAKAFATWRDQFTAIMHRERLLSEALLEPALVDHLRTGALVPPPTLYLVGFDQLTPAQRHFIEALEHSGSAVAFHPLQAKGDALRGSVQLPSPEDQLDWAARWLGQQLSSPSEHGSLALVISESKEQRSLLTSALLQELAPELRHVGMDMASAPWVFGAGPSLSSEVVVQHALDLLQWFDEALPPDRVTGLLLSPYLHSQVDLEDRARFDVAWRNHQTLKPERELASLLMFAHKRQLVFNELQQAFAQRQSAGAQLRTHAEWADFVRTALRLAGWPGPRDPSGIEQFAMEAWDGLLDLLATLDLVSRRISFTAFVDLLRQEAASLQLSAPPSSAHVQILTLAETEGRVFDATLLLDATDQQIPAPERSHPLLSWSLQRQHGMPGTSSERTCALARQRLASLAQRSRDLVLAYPAADEAGPLRPTPLAREIGCHPISPESLVTPRSPRPPVPLIWENDEVALPALPSRQVPGGARVLELQAACGFRAFAALRLNASNLERASFGLDARRAGSVLHRAMDAFWSEVRSQARLRELGPSGRSAPIARAVAQALAPLRHTAEQNAWSQAYLEVLQQRFQQILWSWLDRELERAPFQVQEREQERLLDAGPLELKVRPDRIDAAAEGLVFIDYKTSPRLSIEDWLGERPHLPQLPLYTLLYGPNQVRGVAFARLRAGKSMGWVPLQSEAGIFTKARVHDLALQHELWKTELDRLAENFATGDTRVAPKEYPHSCDWCEFRLLCRVDPSTLGDSSPGVDHGRNSDG